MSSQLFRICHWILHIFISSRRAWHVQFHLCQEGKDTMNEVSVKINILINPLLYCCQFPISPIWASLFKSFCWYFMSILEHSLANAQRRQSLQLERTLHALNVQYQRELAGVQGAQQELRRSLDRLRERSAIKRPVLALPPTSKNHSSSNQTKQTPSQSCCPNHVVCSSCNLRLRLADALTRRFTPSLWTMYTCPLTSFQSEEIYYMPRFVQQRNLSISDNSLRYLPFM